MTIVRTAMAAVLALGVVTTASVVSGTSVGSRAGRKQGQLYGQVQACDVRWRDHCEERQRIFPEAGEEFFAWTVHPDPWLGFGSNGRYSKKTTFAVLKKNKGAQTYKIPASVDISKFNEVYVWCKKFGVRWALRN